MWLIINHMNKNEKTIGEKGIENWKKKQAKTYKM